ncbi:MAG: L-threonylcarbamoyladenylate synthase [Candidatus Limnocylindria bacterium]
MSPPAALLPDDAAGRARAIEVLRDGGVVAIPTDTVYGIAVALATPGGIERLFEVKRRPPEKGIALLLDSVEQATELGIVGPAAEALASACWPGGLTLVLRQRTDVPFPPVLTGGQATIGLRVPAHDAPRSLARVVGPLPTTSANVSGEPEAPDAATVLRQLGDRIDLVLDGGPVMSRAASTVVDVSIDRPRILRAGALDAARIAEVLDVAGVAHDVGR